MRILHIEPEPLHTLPYRTAASGGGVLQTSFPVLRGTVDRLPTGCAALFACSDLQGLADETAGDYSGEARLLGEALADELALLAELGVIPPTNEVGVLLCGDLYVRPLLDARGGLGDVRGVWRAFARHFRWVAGVAGNHDAFGTPAERDAFAREPGIHLLDGDAATLDGLHVAGLDGIIGGKDKPNRRDERSFARELRRLLDARPDVVVLHQGPDVPQERRVGDVRVREALRSARDLLVLCGHAHWATPLATLHEGVQVANLDGRGVLLVPLKTEGVP